MKCLKRNEKPFYYCLYQSDEPIIDEYGNDTGEKLVTYSEPVEMYANISPATGTSSTEIFGNLDNYDKVIVTCDMECPITEESVLFIDKEPETSEVPIYRKTAITVTAATENVPIFDYIVRRVAKSLNQISIAVKKVKVS